jgi:hypothetical protein
MALAMFLDSACRDSIINVCKQTRLTAALQQQIQATEWLTCLPSRLQQLADQLTALTGSSSTSMNSSSTGGDAAAASSSSPSSSELGRAP